MNCIRPEAQNRCTKIGKSLGKCLLVKHVNSSTEDNTIVLLLLGVFLSKHRKIKAFENRQTNAL